jgi:hypothetical protein
MQAAARIPRRRTRRPGRTNYPGQRLRRRTLRAVAGEDCPEYRRRTNRAAPQAD